MADGDVPVLATKLSALHEDVSEIRTAVAKLVLIEERQAQASSAIERIFKAIARLEERVLVIERMMPITDRATKWVYNAVWGAAGAAVVFVAKKAGLL